MGFIVRSFLGQEELWKVFWIYGIFFIFMEQVIVVVLRLAFGIDYENPSPSHEKQLLWLQCIYSFWLIISLWNCAHNVELVVWEWAIKVAITVFILALYVFFYLGGKESALPLLPTRVIHAVVSGVNFVANKIHS